MMIRRQAPVMGKLPANGFSSMIDDIVNRASRDMLAGILGKFPQYAPGSEAPYGCSRINHYFV